MDMKSEWIEKGSIKLHYTTDLKNEETWTSKRKMDRSMKQKQVILLVQEREENNK
jgi:hypothetical protein